MWVPQHRDAQQTWLYAQQREFGRLAIRPTKAISLTFRFHRGARHTKNFITVFPFWNFYRGWAEYREYAFQVLRVRIPWTEYAHSMNCAMRVPWTEHAHSN